MMSEFTNIKTYKVDGRGDFAVPFETDLSELRVYFSTEQDEALLSPGADYVIEPRGADVVGYVRLLKPLDGWLSLARVPDPCVELQKFGVGMLPDLNGWADRVAQRLGFLEHLLGLADTRPIGSPLPAVIAAKEKALYSHALRLSVAVDELKPPANGCSVLGWMHGKPAWVSPESIAARVMAVNQAALNEVSLCDVQQRGLFFGRQPRAADFTAEVVIAPCDPLVWPEGQVLCDLMVAPALIDTMFDLCLEPALPIMAASMVAAVPPVETPACTYRVQVPLSLTQGCCK